ncbi:Hypothetical protein LUCI_4222 [Lucifera butyrica]|uniref:PRD domain-containing protein n=1 Tax=Lucifera butyrica TaxID=1351585 RepID=A0A498R8A5_9FIRM|nr:PRD domain-containing protein [Lucifera butyrica]VBB08936.1 Hypothetical protein LUCI_4222 [Lucifera butyrica]
MEIKKVFNNNVVLAENEKQMEMVVMGRGLAFQKKTGDWIDPAGIEKTFVLERQGISEKIADLLKETSDQYLGLADKIISYAKTALNNKLDDYLYVALTDHLSFAISRHKQGFHLPNALLWEIRKFYKEEFKVGLKALKIIAAETGIQLPEDEAGFITIHLVNSQFPGKGMEPMAEITGMISHILNIVKYHYQMELNETTVSYERFLTHLRFFALRLTRKDSKIYEEEADFFFEQVKTKYAKAFQCSGKIALYIQQTYNRRLSCDEKIYLTLHIQRVTNRQE